MRPLLAAIAALVILASGSLAQDDQPKPAAPARSPAPTLSPATAPATTTTAPTSPPMGVAASRQANNIAVITIEGEIDPHSILATSIERRINKAAADGANAIVFEINSPGGSLLPALQICNLIERSPVPNTIAWVRPHAYSGGAIIALSCREIIVGEAARFGDAMPIQTNPDGSPRKIDPELLRKFLPPLVTEVVRSTRRYNQTFGGYLRDEYLMQAIAANDVELWWVKNTKTGQKMAIDRTEFEMLFPGVSPDTRGRLATGGGALAPPHADKTPTLTQPGTQFPANSTKLASVAKEVEGEQQVKSERPRLTPDQAGEWELIDKITDGTAAATFTGEDMLHYGIAANDSQQVNGVTTLKPIQTDTDLLNFLGGKNLHRYDMAWSEHLAGYLNLYPVKGVLIVIFLIALFVEMTHPGAIVPGTIALIALIVLVSPPFLIGSMAGWWQVAAIITGVVLLGIETFITPGFGFAGVLGLLLLFGGLVGTFVPMGSGSFPAAAPASSDMLWGATTVILSGATAIFGMWLIARHFPSLPVLGKLVLKAPEHDEDSEGYLAAMDPDAGMDVRPGQFGTALTPLRPAGRVEVGEKVVDAISEFGFIPMGAKVRIVNASPMRIGVEEVKGTS